MSIDNAVIALLFQSVGYELNYTTERYQHCQCRMRMREPVTFFVGCAVQSNASKSKFRFSSWMFKALFYCIRCDCITFFSRYCKVFFAAKLWKLQAQFRSSCRTVCSGCFWRCYLVRMNCPIFEVPWSYILFTIEVYMYETCTCCFNKLHF